MKLVLICQIFMKILGNWLQSVFEKMGTSRGAGATTFAIVSNRTLGLCLLEEIRDLASLTILLDWNMMSLECIRCNWSIVDFDCRSAFRHLCLKQQMGSFNQGDELTERTSLNKNLFSYQLFLCNMSEQHEIMEWIRLSTSLWDENTVLGTDFQKTYQLSDCKDGKWTWWSVTWRSSEVIRFKF